MQQLIYPKYCVSQINWLLVSHPNRHLLAVSRLCLASELVTVNVNFHRIQDILSGSGPWRAWECATPLYNKHNIDNDIGGWAEDRMFLSITKQPPRNPLTKFGVAVYICCRQVPGKCAIYSFRMASLEGCLHLSSQNILIMFFMHLSFPFSLFSFGSLNHTFLLLT